MSINIKIYWNIGIFATHLSSECPMILLIWWLTSKIPNQKDGRRLSSIYAKHKFSSKYKGAKIKYESLELKDYLYSWSNFTIED